MINKTLVYIPWSIVADVEEGRCCKTETVHFLTRGVATAYLVRLGPDDLQSNKLLINIYTSHVKVKAPWSQKIIERVGGKNRVRVRVNDH